MTDPHTDDVAKPNELLQSGVLPPEDFARAKARLMAGASSGESRDPSSRAGSVTRTGRGPGGATTSTNSSVDRRRYYDRGAIMVASFLGSPLAGAWVAGSNWRLVGRPGASRLTWVAAAMIVVAMILANRATAAWEADQLGRDVSLSSALAPLNFLVPLLFGAIVWKRQEPYLTALYGHDGARQPYWRAAGAGMIFGTILFAVLWMVLWVVS